MFFLITFYVQSIVYRDIVVPNDRNIVSVGKYKDQVDIRSATFESGIEFINSDAFSGCTALENVVFPESLIKIGMSCFSGCSNLKSVSLEHTQLQKLDHYAFMSCTSLQSVSLPSTFSYLGSSCFSYDISIDINQFSIKNDNPFFTYENGIIYNKEMNTLRFCLQSVRDILIIKDTVENIGQESIIHCNFITEITIPPKVKRLDAFFSITSCLNLRTINIGPNTEYISSEALAYLNALQNINIDPRNNYLTAENGIIYTKGKSEILFYSLSLTDTSFTVPKETQRIGKMVFRSIYALTTFYVEEGSDYMKSIDGVLYSQNGKVLIRCPNNKANMQTPFIIPESVTKIEGGAFYGCGILNSLNLKESNVVSIGENSLTLSGIRFLDLPECCTDLKSGFASSCSLLHTVFLPTHLERIEEMSFAYCTSLEILQLPDNLVSLGLNAFNGCNGLKNVVFPETLEVIERSAFIKCTGLILLNLPKNLLYIEESAFEECTALTSIEIPFNCVRVFDFAFQGCSNVITATLLNCKTKYGKYTFTGCNEHIQIKCVSTIPFTDHFLHKKMVQKFGILCSFFVIMLAE